MRVPRELLSAGRSGGPALAVLADWLEENGQEGWARSLRERPLSWRAVGRVVRPLGMRVRRLDAGFLFLEDDDPVLGRTPLAWRVRDPRRLGELLDQPVFCDTRRFHLTAHRARSALPAVVAALARRRSGLETLELTGRPTDPALLSAFPVLERVTLRPGPGGPGTTPARYMQVRIVKTSDFLHLRGLRTPALETLSISGAADGESVPEAVLARVFERPFRQVAVDRGLRTLVVPALLQARPEVRVLRAPPRSWDEDAERWVIEA